MVKLVLTHISAQAMSLFPWSYLDRLSKNETLLVNQYLRFIRRLPSSGSFAIIDMHLTTPPFAICPKLMTIIQLRKLITNH